MGTDTRLAGRRVAVTADRRWEQQAELLRARGAEVVHAPTVRTVQHADEQRLRAATDDLIDRPPDYVVAVTGMGMRAWFDAAADWQRADDLRDALAHGRVVARGPKARSALGRAGLDVWWQPDTEQLVDIERHLLAQPLRGARVAVQLHGADLPDLVAALRGAGADVLPVPVYRWALPDDLAPVHRLLRHVAEGTVAAVTFTAAPAVHNLFTVARDRQGEGELRTAFDGPVLCACIGPVCAAAAREEGVTAPFEPPRPRLVAFVDALAERLAS